jgi:hypothetical protein
VPRFYPTHRRRFRAALVAIVLALATGGILVFVGAAPASAAPPMPPFSTPVDTSGGARSFTTSDGSLTLGGVADPNAVVHVVDAPGLNTADPSNPTCTATADGAGNWSCQPTTPLAVGNWSLGAFQVDASGTSPSPDPRLNLTVVAGPTTPTITAPADGSSTANPTVNFAGAATGTDNLVTVRRGTTTLCTSPVTAGAWNCTGTLVGGIQTVTATATDTFGTASPAASITVSLTAPPFPTVLTPVDNSSTIDHKVLVSGTVAGGAGDHVWVDEGDLCIALVSASGDWSCTIDESPGTYTLDVQTANAFNVFSLTVHVTFTVVAAKAPIITSPAEGSSLADPTVQFAGTSSGFEGGTVDVTEGGAKLCSGVVAASSDWHCAATEAPGAHTVKAESTDAAKTKSPAASRSFVVQAPAPPTDTPAPPAFDWSLTLTTADGTPVTGSLAAGTSIVLRGSGIPAGYTASAEVHSTPIALGTVTIDSTGLYAIATSVPLDLPPGVHDFIVTTTGPRGDTSVRDDSVTVTAPVTTPVTKPSKDSTATASTGRREGVGGGAKQSPGLDDATHFATSIEPFGTFQFTPAAVAVTSAGALGFLLFVAVPSELLEATVRENYTGMFGWLAPVRRRWDSLRARLRAITLPPAVSATIVGVAATIILAFASPTFGFNGASLRLLLALFISVVVINVGISSIVQLVARQRLHLASSLEALPATLLLVAASVLISRALGVEPGFLFGFVLGIKFAVELGKRREALLALLSIGLTMVVGVGAWLGYSALERANIPDHGFGILLSREVLVAITAEALATMVIGLLPLAFFDGRIIWDWSKWAWAGTYVVALVLFIVIILPQSDNWGKSSAALIGWGGVFIIFSIIAVGLWVWFQVRRRRRAE